jgi:hypothetical protein
MVIALLVAGIAFVLAGALGIFLGIPVKEFSFGNTLILAGAISGCAGMLTLGLAAILRELKQISGQLESGAVAMPSLATAAAPRGQPPESSGFTTNREQASREQGSSAPDSAAPPWHEETVARERARNEPPSGPGSAPSAESTALARQRRNLMFSSSRTEGGARAETRITDLSATDPRPASPTFPPAAKPADSSPPTFEGAWPASERPRGAAAPPQRRSGRTPSTFTEPATGPSGTDRPALAGRDEKQPAVTVLKSGIVDGMAYSLYSDGSIEAQMPEGMMRFGSIDELRAHLDQRS